MNRVKAHLNIVGTVERTFVKLALSTNYTNVIVVKIVVQLECGQKEMQALDFAVAVCIV